MEGHPENTLAPLLGGGAGAGRSIGLGEVALYDPRLAFTLLQTDYVGSGGIICSGSGWEILNLVARWEAVAANQQIEARLLEQICNDLWVRFVTHTVRRPLASAGSPWKGFWDFFNALNPNIDFTLIIKSYCDYAISPDETPLENIRVAFDCVCPAGLVLKSGATFDAFFSNLRALNADENPTEAIVTFHCLRLPRGLYGSCDYVTAVKELRTRGILPP